MHSEEELQENKLLLVWQHDWVLGEEDCIFQSSSALRWSQYQLAGGRIVFLLLERQGSRAAALMVSQFSDQGQNEHLESWEQRKALLVSLVQA